MLSFNSHINSGLVFSSRFNDKEGVAQVEGGPGEKGRQNGAGHADWLLTGDWCSTGKGEWRGVGGNVCLAEGTHGECTEIGMRVAIMIHTDCLLGAR